MSLSPSSPALVCAIRLCLHTVGKANWIRPMIALADLTPPTATKLFSGSVIMACLVALASANPASGVALHAKLVAFAFGQQAATCRRGGMRAHHVPPG